MVTTLMCFFCILQIGKTREDLVGLQTLMIESGTPLTLLNWRWCCYGNWWCCSHSWGALQVKCLIKNFWCMPKLLLWCFKYSFICIWVGWHIESWGFFSSSRLVFSKYFVTMNVKNINIESIEAGRFCWNKSLSAPGCVAFQRLLRFVPASEKLFDSQCYRGALYVIKDVFNFKN